MIEFVWVILSLPFWLLALPVLLLGAQAWGGFKIGHTDNFGPFFNSLMWVGIALGLFAGWAFSPTGNSWIPSVTKPLALLWQATSLRGMFWFAGAYLGIGLLYTFPAAWMHFTDVVKSAHEMWKSAMANSGHMVSQDYPMVPITTRTSGRSSSQTFLDDLNTVKKETSHAFSTFQALLHPDTPVDIQARLNTWFSAVSDGIMRRFDGPGDTGGITTSLPNGVFSPPVHSINIAQFSLTIGYWILNWPGCLLSNLLHDVLRHAIDWFTLRMKGVYNSMLTSVTAAVQSK